MENDPGLPGRFRISAAGQLLVGNIPASILAARYGTPLYVLDEVAIRENCKSYMKAFSENYPSFKICYAGKTFMTMAICAVMESEGLGLDLVSGGELFTALKAGFPPGDVVLHGNNKSRHEISMALNAGVGRIVLDSFDEIGLANAVAKRARRRASVLIRVNPGVEAHTHHYIETGKDDTKFGLSIRTGAAMEAVRRVLQADHLDLKGIHCHIGSQVMQLEPFALAASRMMNFRAEVAAETGRVLEEVNLGGGLGIRYLPTDKPPSISQYVKTIVDVVKDKCSSQGLPLPMLMVEPGRSILGEAGCTIYTVGTVKHLPGIRTYISVDGGMGDNPRPALYQAKYWAVLADRANAPRDEIYSVAGKCCESGDMLIWDIPLPKVRTGDLLVVFSTGAYNYSMASNYNRLPRPAVVLVNGGTADIIVARETLHDLIRKDRIPERLGQAARARDRCAATLETRSLDG